MSSNIYCQVFSAVEVGSSIVFEEEMERMSICVGSAIARFWWKAEKGYGGFIFAVNFHKGMDEGEV